MSDYQFLQYETFDDGQIVRIMLDRPDARNAQNRGLLVELDEAFLRAEADDTCRVVILGGTGPLFSSGHDMGSKGAQAEYATHPSYRINGATRDGAEKRMLQEWHYYFENTRRWRNLRKITIAQVQGTVFAAGLMLMWSCDLIVGSDDAVFADVVGTRLGMCGLEYFAHPWEFGARKTKELMLTGDSLDVHEAHRLGMVSKVFPRDELDDRTLDFARRIAKLPTMTALDDQGERQRDPGQPGLLQLAQRLLHAAPAQPQPLGRGARGRLARGQARRRHPVVERSASHRACREDDGTCRRSGVRVNPTTAAASPL